MCEQFYLRQSNSIAKCISVDFSQQNIDVFDALDKPKINK